MKVPSFPLWGEIIWDESHVQSRNRWSNWAQKIFWLNSYLFSKSSTICLNSFHFSGTLERLLFSTSLERFPLFWHPWKVSNFESDERQAIMFCLCSCPGNRKVTTVCPSFWKSINYYVVSKAAFLQMENVGFYNEKLGDFKFIFYCAYLALLTISKNIQFLDSLMTMLENRKTQLFVGFLIAMHCCGASAEAS